MKSSKKALVIVGHGSKRKGFAKPMEQVATRLRAGKKFEPVVCAYLEINTPSIPDAIRFCAERNVSHILVLPYFLLKGRHTERDIPRLVRETRKALGPSVKITLCPYLGYHEKIVSVVKERVR